MSELSPNDMIFYKEGDKIMSGGFSIESLLLKNGGSPMYTKNDDSNFIGGRAVSDLFKNLAVPSGLLYQPSKEKKRNLFEYNEKEYEGGFKDAGVLPEDIHSQFMKFIELDNSKKAKREKKTRRHSKEKKNNSKKSKSSSIN
jgi:hypothetical protein